MDDLFQPTLYWSYDYFSTQGLKLTFLVTGDLEPVILT